LEEPEEEEEDMLDLAKGLTATYVPLINRKLREQCGLQL
jgi:hypothetical protein